jgi:hypothetical protein
MSPRITAPLATALAIGAALAPAAAAQQQDLRSPDARDAARQASPVQDLRSPDTRDRAAGRGPETAPTIQFVRVPESSGFDWDDAVIGAGAGLGLVLIAVGGALTTARIRRRTTSPLAS